MTKAKVVKTTQKWVDALDKTIKEKWVPLSKGQLDEEPECALCIFARRTQCVRCGPCPVAKYAGTSDCLGTPFYGWREAAYTIEGGEHLKAPGTVAAAKKELASLRRVRCACVVTKGGR